MNRARQAGLHQENRGTQMRPRRRASIEQRRCAPEIETSRGLAAAGKLERGRSQVAIATWPGRAAKLGDSIARAAEIITRN